MLAHYAFTGAHLVMIVGVILVAAGITDAIHHFDGHAHRWWLGCGTAVFLLGHAAYRGLLGSGRLTDRLVGAVCAVPLGATVSIAGRLGMTLVGASWRPSPPSTTAWCHQGRAPPGRPWKGLTPRRTHPLVVNCSTNGVVLRGGRTVRELGLVDTVGILRRPGVRPRYSSAGLGWEHLYVSSQQEQSYRATFAPAPTHLLILHLSGPVTVRRGQGSTARSRTIPAGGLFLQPAGRELSVELGGGLDTVHAYLTDQALREANEGQPVELSEQLGVTDPLAEQLMIALDGVVRRWEPSARTYVDHLTGMLAAQLARRHASRPAGPSPARSGLSDRQLAAVRDLMRERLADPLPITDLAAAASLSSSQFTRQFRASTGQSPHQYLLGLRLEQACRLLRTGSAPIGQVAIECGFSHQEHLTRVMRARLDTTPAVVRREG